MLLRSCCVCKCCCVGVVLWLYWLSVYACVGGVWEGVGVVCMAVLELFVWLRWCCFRAVFCVVLMQSWRCVRNVSSVLMSSCCVGTVLLCWGCVLVSLSCTLLCWRYVWCCVSIPSCSVCWCTVAAVVVVVPSRCCVYTTLALWWCCAWLFYWAVVWLALTTSSVG